MAGGREKRAPKRNTVYQNALYAPRFLPRLAIGACCEAGLSSEPGVYDGDGGEDSRENEEDGIMKERIFFSFFEIA
jgi:hypothetical protein